MSIPQIDTDGRGGWRDITGDCAVWLLKFTIVVILPAWAAVCLSSLFFTPARAVMTGVGYGDVWLHTTLVTGVIMYLLMGLYLVVNPGMRRE